MEVYIVDMIKQAVKDPLAPNLSKFNALYLLKELMKTRNKRFVDYVERKLGDRLDLLATSDKGDECLLVFNRNGDKVWSANFHHLNLECFQAWAAMFRTTNPGFDKTAAKLRIMKRLPIDNKFYELRGAEPQEPPHQWDNSLMVTGGAKVAEKLSRVKKARAVLRDYLATAQFPNIPESMVGELHDRYKAAYADLDKDPQTQMLLKSMGQRLDPADRKMAEDINLEAVFLEQLQQIVDSAKTDRGPADFVEKFEVCYNVFFENEKINLAQQVARLKGVKEVREPERRRDDGMQPTNRMPEANHLEERLDRLMDNYQTEGNVRAETPLNDQNVIYGMAPAPRMAEAKTSPSIIEKTGPRVADDSYDFNLLQDMKGGAKRLPDYIESPKRVPETAKSGNLEKKAARNNLAGDIRDRGMDAREENREAGWSKKDQLFQENEALKREIGELESKKKNLEHKVSKYGGGRADRANPRASNTSDVFTPQNDGAGFFKVLKNKDDQIDRLAHRINKLEKEFQRMSFREESPDQFLTSRRRILDDVSMEATSQLDALGASRYQSARKLMRLQAERQSEASGSVFVDQMYKEINRLLNKPPRTNLSTRNVIY